MEVLKHNESQAILGRNAIVGENPCNTVTPGKSRCVVRGKKNNFFSTMKFLLFSTIYQRFNLLYIK